MIRPKSTQLYLIAWAEQRIQEIFWIPEHVLEADALDKALLRIKKALAVIEKHFPSL